MKINTFATAFSGADAAACAILHNPALAHWEHVFCSQIRPEDSGCPEAEQANAACACAVLAHRYPAAPNVGDITAYHGDYKADVLIGGPPCQPYSNMGLRRGEEDDRASLIFEMQRLAEQCDAKVLILENVLALGERPTFAPFFKEIIHRMAKAGWFVGGQELDPRMVGMPVRRRRLYIVAVRGVSQPQQFRDIVFRDWPSHQLIARKYDWTQFLETGPHLLEFLITPENAARYLGHRRTGRLAITTREAFQRAAHGIPTAGEVAPPGQRPIFWTYNFGLKDSASVPTITKGGTCSIGVLVRVGGELYPRLLTAK